jgi:transcriptional regulator with XRE-family HTH domain
MGNDFHHTGGPRAFRERLRMVREQVGYSQEELASKAGLSRPCIGQYETLIRWPQPEIMIALSEALDVSPLWLAWGNGYGCPDSEGGTPPSSAAARMAAMIEIQMTQANRAIIFEAWGGRCAICEDAPAHHIDHIVARHNGGTDALGNRAPACESCNTRKGHRTLPEAQMLDLLERAGRIAQRIIEKADVRKKDHTATRLQLQQALVALRVEDHQATLKNKGMAGREIELGLENFETETWGEVMKLATLTELRNAINNLKGDRHRAKRRSKREDVGRRAEELYPDLIAAGQEQGMSLPAAKAMADQVMADHRITRAGWMETCIRNVRVGKGIPVARGAQRRREAAQA